MKKIDFNEYRFRCSSLGTIMTGVKGGLTDKQKTLFNDLDKRYKGEGRPLTDNQRKIHAELLAKKELTPKLSQTVTSYLEKLFKEEVTGKRTDIETDAIWKGRIAEESSITLYSNFVNEPFFKNSERRSNDFITGEPDNVDGKIRDVKTSWNLDTFPMFEIGCPNNGYWWQLQGYMELWDIDEAELIYCLVDTPNEMIEDAKRRFCWRRNYIDIPEEDEKRIESNMTFYDIPEQFRVRIFDVKRDKEAIVRLYAQIELCRDYLNKLNKQLYNEEDKTPITQLGNA
jgi:hypothetical protein